MIESSSWRCLEVECDGVESGSKLWIDRKWEELKEVNYLI